MKPQPHYVDFSGRTSAEADDIKTYWIHFSLQVVSVAPSLDHKRYFHYIF